MSYPRRWRCARSALAWALAMSPEPPPESDWALPSRTDSQLSYAGARNLGEPPLSPPALPCRNLRVRKFLAVCMGCYLCRPSATYVHVGYSSAGGQYAELSKFRVAGPGWSQCPVVLARSGELGDRLADAVQQRGKPRRGDVERLAAPDPLELDGPEFVAALLVVPDQARLTA
jgi:hypothetical protein